MTTKLRSIWRRLRESYWFVPGLMTLGAFILASLMIRLDELSTLEQVKSLRFVYLNQPDGARSLLSTVASSMIGVAGVTFSLTMVVLSLTSSQYGPRLLGSFMRDTGNQIVLGTFIATYLYCLLILRTIRTTGSDSFFVPNLSITVGVILAVASLGVFIYFIHHTAESIRAGTIISNVARDLQAAIEANFEDKQFLFHNDEGPDLPDDYEQRLESVNSEKTGYLQPIDEDALVSLAQKHDIIVQIKKHSGEFVGIGEPILTVYRAEQVDDALRESLSNHCIFSSHRSGARDFTVLFEQLVEIALRALSPGINDPFTAVMCLDRIGEALAIYLERDHSAPYELDEDGNLRLINTTLPVVDLIRSTLGPIRHYGSSDLIVLRSFLETVRLVLHYATSPEERSALHEQARLAVTAGRESLAREDYILLDQTYRIITDEAPQDTVPAF